MHIRFDGKRVVVSGAARGLGRDIARAFADLGARVHACDRDAASLPGVAEFGAVPKLLDLRDRAAVTAWGQELERDGGVDVLVNNAGGPGGAVGAPIEEVTDEEWDRVLDINAGAAFALSRAIVPVMKRQGRGSIVNISSGAGIQPSRTGILAYTAAKHAVVGITRQMAHDLGPHGITVNSVAPGFMRTTPEVEQHWERMGPEGQRALIAGTALRRIGRTEDVVNAVLFLASDKASWITGQVLPVDGGK